jgi:hypothetical protein
MKWREWIHWVVSLALVFVTVSTAYAQTGGGYDLTWSTIDGGGGVSNGGAYSLGGTVGQPDAGAMTGGVYTLVGGFWGGGVSGAISRYVYLPIVLR